MVFVSADGAPERLAELGGKARGLWELEQAGLPVPAWICLPLSCFEQALAPYWSALRRQLAGTEALDPIALAARAEVCAGLLAPLELPAEVRTALPSALAALGGDSFAVRSSARGEDGGRASFAGLFTSRLQVPPEQVADAILAVWRQAFAARVLAYLAERRLAPESLAMAVVIQRQLDADCAGVLFQADAAQLNDQLIVAAYGLGEGVVAEAVAADTYAIDRFSGETRARIPVKAVQLRPGPAGPRLQPVPPELQRAPVLSLALRQELLALTAPLAATGFYDIEWCRAQGRWYLLQARPITTLPPGPYTAYDGSNIQESYPGVMLPLSAELVQSGYSANFRQLLRKLGFSPAFLARQAPVLDRLTASFEGRLYYHLPHWYTVLQWIPGTRRLNLRAFGEMIGRTPVAAAPADGPGLLTGLRLYAMLLLRLATLGWAFGPYRRRFEAVAAAFEAEPRDGWSAERLLAHFELHFPAFLALSYVPLLNDLLTGLLGSLLRRALRQRLPEQGQALLHELLAALPENAGARPLQALQALAARHGADPALADLLAAASPQAAWERLGSDAAAAALYAGLQDYLQAYGGRSLDELKLEAPSFHEEPWQLLGLLRSLPPARPAGSNRAALQRLRQLWPRWHPRGLLLEAALHLYRRALARREAGRLDRARMMAAARLLVRQLGAQLVAEQCLDTAEDVYYLERQQLRDGTDLRQLAAAARQRDAAYRLRAPRERLLLPARPTAIPQQLESADEAGSELGGLGCAGGIAEGEVLVLTRPRLDAAVDGKILVALSTDPGWVFLMARARGLIVERGNLLSHAAIMARELGLPTVVGVRGACRRLHDGERLRIDGRSGRIDRLPPA